MPHLSAESLHRQPRSSLVIPVFGGFGVQTYRRWNRFALCGDVYDQSFGYLKDFTVRCRRMLLSKTEFQTLERGGIIAGILWDRVSKEDSNDNWVVVRTGKCSCDDDLDLLALARDLPNSTQYPILVEWHLAEGQTPLKELSPLAKLWKEWLPSPFIPYDYNERQAAFSAAFAQMKELIAKHEIRLADERKKELARASKRSN